MWIDKSEALYAAADVQPDLVSPNGDLKLKVTHRYGRLGYELAKGSRPLVRCDHIGLEVAGDPTGFEGARILKLRSRSVNECWSMPWGIQAEHYDHCNELTVDCQAHRWRFLIEFRLYDTGFAFRTVVPKAPGQPDLRDLTVVNEHGGFAFADPWTVWAIQGHHRNSYEQLYQQSPLKDLTLAHMPLAMRRADGLHACIHECNIRRYPTAVLKGVGENRLAIEPTRWSDGTVAKTSTPFATPWRALVLAPDAASLADDQTLLNLAEPCRLSDTSWIRPFRFVGVWWEMHRQLRTWSLGPLHGATTQNTLKHIEFAARHGIEAVLVEGWNTGWDGNWTQNRDQFDYIQSYPDFDLDRVMQAANATGVALILQNETAGGVARYLDLYPEAFGFYASKGVKAVKTGHVALGRDIDRIDADGRLVKELHGSQYMIDYLHGLLECAALHKLMIDMHEPVIAGCLHRTYPHLMALEGARGQEYNAWSDDGGNPPDHVLHLPFTRLKDGPFDYTPGIFDLRFESSKSSQQAGQSIHEGAGVSQRSKQSANCVRHTLAKELALFVLLPSPAQMLCDLIQNYEDCEAFEVLKKVAVDWAWSRTLDAEIGDFMMTARGDRHSGRVVVGAAVAETGREIELSLQQLGLSGDYILDAVVDGPDANWRDNPQAFERRTGRLASSDQLKLRLAPGGGALIILDPV